MKTASGETKAGAVVRSVSEVPWDELPGHLGGAYSKMLVRPEVCGSKHIDHRISCYQPRAHVAPHAHKAQEQVYHVIEGEGLVELDGRKQVVRKHDVVFVPPGVVHSLHNTGLTDLIFLVVTSPPDDVP